MGEIFFSLRLDCSNPESIRVGFREGCARYGNNVFISIWEATHCSEKNPHTEKASEMLSF
jgi:hypothetical protein